MQCSTGMRAHDRKDSHWGFRVPPGLGCLPGQKARAELCRKTMASSAAVGRPLLPDPIVIPGYVWTLLPPGKPVTEQEQTLDLRVHGQKMPFPKATPPLPTEAPGPTQAAKNLPSPTPAPAKHNPGCYSQLPIASKGLEILKQVPNSPKPGPSHRINTGSHFLETSRVQVDTQALHQQKSLHITRSRSLGSWTSWAGIRQRAGPRSVA